MCGIFGYIGMKKNASASVIDGLCSLEYRGYDSWGLASLNEKGKLEINKKVGKISDFKNKSKLQKANIAIGHSRWATHGKVTVKNAHPHQSGDKKIVVVHNGIIENYLTLRKSLEKSGVKLSSDTDTEIIPHLIAKFRKKYSFQKAVRMTCQKLTGRYAITILSRDDNQIIVARRGSPIILGVDQFFAKKTGRTSSKCDANGFFIASDAPAFLDITRDVIYLDDEEMAVIEVSPIGDHYHTSFTNIDTGIPVKKRLITLDFDKEDADKGKHEHYMMKEILDQKQTIQSAISQDPHAIMSAVKKIKNAYGVFFTGCGTAHKACMVGEYFFAKISKKHVNTIASSEFSTFKNFLTSKTLLVAVSQSGETADVLEAVGTAKDAHSKVLAVTNVPGSTLTRLANYNFLINAGVEKAVASTKAATSQMAILLLFAFAAADRLTDGEQLLIDTAGEVNDMLNPRYFAHIKKLAKKIYHQKNIYIIGREENYPVALESAIKIQEVSYIHAEGFAAGEMKHGPIALITKNVPVIVICNHAADISEIISNAMELKSRGAYIIGVGPVRQEIFDYWIRTPDVGIASPIVNLIPIQILSYYLALACGKNPDMPRNLAKSVTVK